MALLSHMRRKEKEVCNRQVINQLLDTAQVLRLGMCDQGEPYIVPLLFGRDGDRIYLHSAREGRKLDILRRGGMVCFEVEEVGEVSRKDLPCKWTVDYVSVIGWGEARLITEPEEMRAGLDAIMRHYGGRPPFEYSEQLLSKVLVVRIDITSMTCKRSM